MGDACARSVVQEYNSLSSIPIASNVCVDPYLCNSILTYNETNDNTSDSQAMTKEVFLTCQGTVNQCNVNDTTCVCNSNADCVGLGTGNNYCCGTFLGYVNDTATSYPQNTVITKNTCIPSHMSG